MPTISTTSNITGKAYQQDAVPSCEYRAAFVC